MTTRPPVSSCAGRPSRADGTPIDDSVRVQLLLLRERAAAWSDEFHDGRWAHYVRALPGRRTHPRAPALVVRRKPSPTTRGSAMHADVLEDRAHLEHLSRALADANARVPSDPTASQSPPFPEDALRTRPPSMGARRVLVARHRAPAPLLSRGAGAGAGSDGALTPLPSTRVTTMRRRAYARAQGRSRRTRRRA